MGDATSWSEAAIAIAGILFVTTVATVVVWQIFGTWRARMSVAREEAYRRLAEEATAAQQRIAGEQRKVAEELAELRGRVGAIEKLLREVE
jgi:hypothetical protein